MDEPLRRRERDTDSEAEEDSDGDQEDQPGNEAGAGGQREARHHVALLNFLRLMGGGPMPGGFGACVGCKRKLNGCTHTKTTAGVCSQAS